MAQLRSVICHMHTVLPATRHKWKHPTLTPAMQASTRFSYPGGMEGWVDLVDLIALWPWVEPATFRSWVQRSTNATTKTRFCDSLLFINPKSFPYMRTGCAGCGRMSLLNWRPSRASSSSWSSPWLTVCNIPHLYATNLAVDSESPVTSRTVIPALWHWAIAAGTWITYIHL